MRFFMGVLVEGYTRARVVGFKFLGCLARRGEDMPTPAGGRCGEGGGIGAGEGMAPGRMGDCGFLTFGGLYLNLR